MHPQSILKEIIHCGIQPQHIGTETARRIAICNILALVLIALALPYIFFFYALELPIASMGGFGIIAWFTLVLILNKENHYYIARWCMCIGPIIILLAYTYILGAISEVQNLFFGTILFPCIVFEIHKKISIYFLSLAQATSFFTCQILMPLDPLVLSEYQLSSLRFGLNFSALLLLFISVKYFLDQNWKNERRLNSQLFKIKHSEESLNHLLRDLQQKNQELGTFAHVVAHDIQSPVNNILSSLQLLKFKLQPNMSSTDEIIFEKTASQGKRIKSLIEGILEYTKTGADLSKQDYVDLENLINDLKSDIGLENKNFSYTLNIESMHINRIALIRVLINLLNNAVKYSKGEENDSIQLKVDEQDENYIIVVKDNGVGIPSAFQEEIFELFSRAPTQNSNNFSSTGIGLAVVKKIVILSGGSIHCKSNENEGSTFTITWPKKLPLTQTIPSISNKPEN